MPPYVALAIASMQRALGDSFILLTPKTVAQALSPAFTEKKRDFEPLTFDMDSRIRAIVAKSDHVRLAYIYRYGGVWLDADTLLFRDPTRSLFPEGLTNSLHWYSEALFGARKGNGLLGMAVEAAARRETHQWGDPGGIRSLIAGAPDHVSLIPFSALDPGYKPVYNFSTCDVMRRQDVLVNEFLATPGVDVLKLYNTYFTRTSTRVLTVKAFLKEQTLLAKLFLHIDPDISYWSDRAEEIMTHCRC